MTVFSFPRADEGDDIRKMMLVLSLLVAGCHVRVVAPSLKQAGDEERARRLAAIVSPGTRPPVVFEKALRLWRNEGFADDLENVEKMWLHCSPWRIIAMPMGRRTYLVTRYKSEADRFTDLKRMLGPAREGARFFDHRLSVCTSIHVQLGTWVVRFELDESGGTRPSDVYLARSPVP